MGRFLVAATSGLAGVLLLLLGHSDPGVYFTLFGGLYLVYATVTNVRELRD